MSKKTSNFELQLTTPLTSSELGENEVLVFSSSLAGYTPTTVLEYGAIDGTAMGRRGKTYALPTKDVDSKYLKIIELRHYVDTLLDIAKASTEIFKVELLDTYYKKVQIALLFERVYEEKITNVHLPREYSEVLQVKYGNSRNHTRTDCPYSSEEAMGITPQEG